MLPGYVIKLEPTQIHFELVSDYHPMLDVNFLYNCQIQRVVRPPASMSCKRNMLIQCKYAVKCGHSRYVPVGDQLY